MEDGRMRRIYSNHLMISTVLPLAEILGVEVIHQKNRHGYAKLSAHIVQGEKINDYIDEKIYIYRLEEESNLLFLGKVQKISMIKTGAYAKAEIEACSHTIELEKENHSRSFQKADTTYEELSKKVLGKWGGTALWLIGKGQTINVPIIQYEENNWEFLQRLASHFQTALYPVLTAERVVEVGWKYREERRGGEVLEEGLSDLFYAAGGYGSREDRRRYSYLKVRHTEEWKIGDYLVHNGFRYIVYQRVMEYRQGEITFFYDLGTEGMLYEKKQGADKLKGIRLKGVIRKVIRESVMLQLDIDSAEENGYAWPWTPETGNTCYIMPETGTEAMLYFPTNREGEGMALHLLHREGFSSNTSHKELITNRRKAIKLYPNEIFVEAGDGTLKLSDHDVMAMDSEKSIQLTAEGDIAVSGNRVLISGPGRIVCRTGSSNIEICRSFNFYAPNGVKKAEKVKGEVKTETGSDAEECAGYYQASFAALAAIPAMDYSSGLPGEEMGVELLSEGSIPIVGDGRAAFAMMEVMQGKRKEEVSFPEALDSMENYTNNGSYFLPEE